MGAPNTIGGSEVKYIKRPETQEVKIKLRITIVVTHRQEGKQFSLSALFRSGQIEKIEGTVDWGEEVMGGCITFDDADEGNYLCIDKTFAVEEMSPKAMQTMMSEIDNLIYGYCLDPNTEEVVVCLLIPTMNPLPVSVMAMLHSFEVKGLTKGSAYPKVSISNSMTLVYAFTKTSPKCSAIEPPRTEKMPNAPMKKAEVQMAALMSYYVYFYVDLYENNNWRIISSSNNLYDSKRIEKFVDQLIDSRNKTESLEQPPLLKKIISSMFGPLWISKAAGKVFRYLFDYGGHLEKRIYTRIADVFDITYSYDSSYKIELANTITKVLNACKEKNAPVDIHTFYKLCGYWDYLQDSTLFEECEKWVVSENENNACNNGFVSGYGAVLFNKRNTTDYIYVFKGTDFDSYFRDWFATNLLQGLTGFSAQHLEAETNALMYDSYVADLHGNLWFAGHSLGGGLASAATIATENRTAVTFNAAGLNFFSQKLICSLSPRVAFKRKKLLGRLYHPDVYKERITPYRISGEFLDNFQKTVGLRGCGKKSIEIDLKGKDLSCSEKHGINNFLFREVILNLDTFSSTAGDAGSTGNNKIKRIWIESKLVLMEASLA